MNKIINILFVHPLEGNAYEVFKAFNRMKNVNIVPLIEKSQKLKYSFISKVRYRLRLHQDIYQINNKLLSYDLTSIDIVFVIKGNEIYPSTLKNLKEKKITLRLINFSLDDMYAKHNRSFFYTNTLKYYDLVVTTKSHNINELPQIGAKKILFHYQAYSKDIHIPMECSSKYKHDVLFIGYPEEERIGSILFLAEQGIVVNIYGYPSAWKKNINKINNKNIVIHNKSLYGKEYSEALSCAKISLCFLRKINRDLHTSRSIEIPACRGFMIAEKTNEHLELFEEDTEAVYFDSNEELLQKVQYYLKNDEKRVEIAQNGYKRCISSGYSYDDRVKEILNEVLENES